MGVTHGVVNGYNMQCNISEKKVGLGEEYGLSCLVFLASGSVVFVK